MEVISIPSVRSIEYGPYDIDVVDDATGRVQVALPSGGTLVYAGVVPRLDDSSRSRAQISLYRTENVLTTNYEKQFAEGFTWAHGAYAHAVNWFGRYKVPEDTEYTIEVSVHNLTGTQQKWVATFIVEVDN